MKSIASEKKLLVIQCSPRGDQSNSFQLAEYFTQGLVAHDKYWQVENLNLWQQYLPTMDITATSAKYAVMAGLTLSIEQQKAWNEIEQHFHHFNSADALLIVLPVWNFGVPYVLKHYIDVITQPGLCFSWTPDTGYTPLVQSRQCVIVSSSGSDYRPGAGHEDDDFCISYLERWLNVYLGYTVEKLTFSPTAQDATGVGFAKQQAFNDAELLYKYF